MDKEPEEMQSLNVFGIVHESFKLMRAYGRILAALTATLVLPLCFVIMGHHLVTDPLVEKINRQEMSQEDSLKEGRAPSEKLRQNMDAELAWLLVVGLVYLVFALAFSLLSFAAIVYTVACIYTGKGVSYTKVLSVVPKVWKRLMVTFLWAYLIAFGYQVAMVFSIIIVVLISEVVQWLLFPLLFVFLCSFVGMLIYLNMIWNLASVVSVLEEVYGLGAVRNSVYLLKGKRWVACGLVLLYACPNAILSSLFQDLVVDSTGSVWGRVVNGAILISLFSGLWLMGLIVQSILYFSCKAYHHESIDRYVLGDHLDGYLGEYMPLKDPIALETLDP